MAETFLTDHEVAARYKVQRTTPWRWAQRGDFPKPIKLSGGCTRWRLSDIEAWEETRQAVPGNYRG